MEKWKHEGLVLAGIAAFCSIWHPPNVLAGNGDYDFDLDVDWEDFAYWAGCMTGGEEGGVTQWELRRRPGPVTTSVCMMNNEPCSSS